MTRTSIAVALTGIMLSACSSTCDNAGVSSDPQGRLVVAVPDGFTSPNSDLLDRVRSWPQTALQHAGPTAQSYALAPGGQLYLLRNTHDHPNLVYRVNLKDGSSSQLGNSLGTHEVEIAADDRYVYAVEQFIPQIRRAPLRPSSHAPQSVINGRKTKLQSPFAIAIDRNGGTCVLESERAHVLCFDKDAVGNVAPSRDLDLEAAGFSQVFTLTIDLRGNTIVSGALGDRGAIATYAPSAHGNQPPIRFISGARTGLAMPASLTTDSSGAILAMDQRDASLSAFRFGADGNVAPMWKLPSGAFNVYHPYRIAMNPKTNTLAVHGWDGLVIYRGSLRRGHVGAGQRYGDAGGAVAVLASGFVLAAQTDGGINAYGARISFHVGTHDANFDDPEFVAVDPSGRVHFASSSGVSTILRPYSQRHFGTPFGRDIDAFAVDDAGYMYLTAADKNAVVVVDPRGREAILQGSDTGLASPSGVAVDTFGSVYVANQISKSIAVFARGATGNAKPLRTISGGATELQLPSSVALDASGRIYVFDGPRRASGSNILHYIRVYGPGANGDVHPIMSYAVKSTCWIDAI